jgi:outer membrane receptor protein involved in Fe transport
MDYEKTKLDYDISMSMNLNVMAGPRPIPMSMDTVLHGSESMSFTEFLPKVALKYEFDDKHYVYASAANGYKTGGYNIQMFADLIREAMMSKRPGGSFNPSESVSIKDAVSYKPEYSWNYEIGFKGDLVKNFLYGEITGYFIDVKDVQLTKFVDSGQGRMISNAGHATSKGIDLSLTAHLFDGFNMIINYGYTHATFKDYISNSIDYSGKYVPFAPGNTLSLSTAYDKRFQNKFIDRFNIQGQYNAAGRIYWTDTNDTYQNFSGALNLRGSVTKGILELAVWTRNTLNTEYTAFYFETKESGKPLAQKGKPFLIGVDLSILF